ncbi:uncharacterized protein LOC143604443 [Bidens hawaiensis]|uniref:uncharacterized protein LOC143604443 n=1 Tax=Bidens hawaiensis TaxID=980011 RepID=UPI00404A7B06
MSDKAETSKPNTLHPVNTVTDIQKKVRVLDEKTVTYSAWVKLFHLHARGYDWIYGTLSDKLLDRVLELESTALEAWNRVKALFQNNKGARMAALTTQFVTLQLSAMPDLESYCQKLKSIADQLNDLGRSVNEQALVLQLVRGLPSELDAIGTIINNSIPSWDKACDMLDHEQRRI